jgi:hypothetical protein
MSDNYKVIRQTREHIKDLKAAGWSHGKIAKTIDVAHPMVADILNIDEVALDLREPTIKKLRKFNDTRSAAIKFRETAEKAIEKHAGPLPAAVPDPPPPDLERQKLQPVLKEFVISDDLLAMTDSLIAEYNERGYRMDVQISKIYKPENDEKR